MKISIISDGSQEYSLEKKLTALTVSVDGVAKTVGVYGIGAVENYECLYDFNGQKIIFQESLSPLTGEEIEISGMCEVEKEIRDAIEQVNKASEEAERASENLADLFEKHKNTDFILDCFYRGEEWKHKIQRIREASFLFDNEQLIKVLGI